MGHKRIAIVTDSTCDIPADLIEEYGILVQAHTIIWNGQQYRDRVDLQPDEFYRRLSTDPVMPTTSQATGVDFHARYQQACEHGAEEIVAIVVNSKFSGAYQSALQGMENISVPVHVYDSRAASMGLGWQVLAAARAYVAGGGAAEILAAADAVRQRVQLLICLDTLEYVYRGGRIGNASRLLGTALGIKPLIYIDHERGIVEPGGMAMTRRKGLRLLFDRFFASMDHCASRLHAGLRVAVLHGDAPREAAELLERVREERHPEELLTNITCPALGINTGPQAIALCGYCE